MKNRIKELRKYLNLNQTEFGDRIGVKQGTIAGYENGVRVPIDAVVLSICREFNVNESWLRYGEGDMFRTQTKEEELFELFGMMMGDSSREAEFKRRLITVMLRMRPEEWSLLERKARELLEETKKDAP